jgi:hypothetical protein
MQAAGRTRSASVAFVVLNALRLRRARHRPYSRKKRGYRRGRAWDRAFVPLWECLRVGAFPSRRIVLLCPLDSRSRRLRLRRTRCMTTRGARPPSPATTRTTRRKCRLNQTVTPISTGLHRPPHRYRHASHTMRRRKICTKYNLRY